MLSRMTKAAEDSQRKAKEERERDRQRAADALKEKAKTDAVHTEKRLQLRALRMQKEAADREAIKLAPKPTPAAKKAKKAAAAS